MMEKNTMLFSLKDVGKEYQGPAEKIIIFSGLNLDIAEGDSVAVVGASGSGKSTLLHLLGTLDNPSRGTVLFRGRDITAMTAEQKAAMRSRDVGFVFQFHHLLPEFNTQENVAMQAVIAGMPRREAMKKAAHALELVGMSGRAGHRVGTLSGGERQRAAIARAILMHPAVLLADEPTGNLDERTGDSVGQLLMDLNRELGMTLVVVTHNNSLASLMNRRLELRAGELYDQNC
ncbi:ABC transporter ATP-binding protein [Oleidesulfovibrio alaskensis]|jgi:lipoprotein-releasing system ATP-binding protein|uniref:ABC transporter ATP-binding protein n=1 Tax=Oleidesulfovibrio alaskensis TaxID=58180 RepID=UPI001A53CB61|nr:ABC transporter ATP-binding protein [Oleidesulfovibrio alaskensis]MBL3580905.1 ABC transporter ATP-binding protein [Oleidesulfovibrio alaskensis]